MDLLQGLVQIQVYVRDGNADSLVKLLKSGLPVGPSGNRVITVLQAKKGGLGIGTEKVWLMGYVLRQHWPADGAFSFNNGQQP